jgi:hypothetical protein
VRSGASWDEVRVQLLPDQKPEDIDEATRALASARGVPRCQVRELSPNVVSIDFQRRNLLADSVSCPDLTTLSTVEGRAVDLHRVWAGCTEYGQEWHITLAGGHTLTAGEGTGPAVTRASLQADLLAAHERTTRLHARVQHLEKRLSEANNPWVRWAWGLFPALGQGL